MTPMSGRASGTPVELGTLREVVEHFRTVLTEWDRFLDWVQEGRRELEDLRARFDALERDHARLRETSDLLRERSEHEQRELAELRSAHDALRQDYDRAHEELRTVRQAHESMLRERQDAYDVLEAALRRLKP
jgi:chromosome segregation ATPase